MVAVSCMPRSNVDRVASTCVQVPAPPQIQAAGYSHVQFTLVDCPGHASLIRTIIGGAQVG